MGGCSPLRGNWTRFRCHQVGRDGERHVQRKGEEEEKRNKTTSYAQQTAVISIDGQTGEATKKIDEVSRADINVDSSSTAHSETQQTLTPSLGILQIIITS